MFGDTAESEMTTAEALSKQYRIADSAKATGFPMQLRCVGTNKSSTNGGRPGYGLRCSVMVGYASDQSPHRHCLAAKAEAAAFLGVTIQSLTRLQQQSQTMVRLNYGHDLPALQLRSKSHGSAVIFWM